MKTGGLSRIDRLDRVGLIKQQPADFIVEEIPLYEPTGDGEHLFLWIEKTDLANEQMLKRVARDLGIRTSDIGVAGQKDRRAVTRQYISVPADAEPRVGRMESENLRVLRTARHGNKLKTGHLRGNRFEIRVRISDPGDLDRCLAACRKTSKKILSEGFPNPFGAQRFGQDGQTAELGFDLLAGRKQPRDLPRQRQRYLVRLALSAAQSTVFNATVESRLADGELRTAFAGDVMQFVGSSGRFLATNADAEQVRIDAGEIVPTGPMFGVKMQQPEGVVAKRELEIFRQYEIDLSHLRRFRKTIPGTRRPLIQYGTNLEVDGRDGAIRFCFELPAGTYATVLLAEFFRIETAAG